MKCLGSASKGKEICWMQETKYLRDDSNQVSGVIMGDSYLAKNVKRQKGEYVE